MTPSNPYERRDGWELIETAPRDGSPILAWFPQASFEAALTPCQAVIRWGQYDAWEVVFSAIVGDDNPCVEDWQPSRWQHLPHPPLANPQPSPKENDA